MAQRFAKHISNHFTAMSASAASSDAKLESKPFVQSTNDQTFRDPAYREWTAGCMGEEGWEEYLVVAGVKVPLTYTSGEVIQTNPGCIVHERYKPDQPAPMIVSDEAPSQIQLHVSSSPLESISNIIPCDSGEYKFTGRKEQSSVTVLLRRHTPGRPVWVEWVEIEIIISD